MIAGDALGASVLRHGEPRRMAAILLERELRTRRRSGAGIGVAHLRARPAAAPRARQPPARGLSERAGTACARGRGRGVGNLGILARGLGCAMFRSVVPGNSFHMITIDNDRRQVVRETLEFASTVGHGIA